MRRTWPLLGAVLAIASVIALALWGTCGGPPVDDVCPAAPAPPPTVRAGTTRPTSPPPARRAAPRAAAPAADDIPSAPPVPAAVTAPSDAPRVVTIRVVSALGGELKDLRVRALGMRYDASVGRVWEFDPLDVTGARGVEAAPGPDGVARFTVAAASDTQRVAAYAKARGVHTRAVIFDLDATLEGTITLGVGATAEGAVLDAAGKPVAGAEVRIVPLGRPASGRLGDNVKLWAEPGTFEFYVPELRTDAQGRWRLPGIPTPPAGGAVRRAVIARDAAGRWWCGDEFLAETDDQRFVADVHLGPTPYVAEPAPTVVRLAAEGRVLDAETGEAIDLAKVTVIAPTAGRLPRHGGATVRGDGSFGLTVLWDASRPREDVRLRAEAPGYRAFSGALPDAPAVIRLVPDREAPRRGRLAGRLVRPDGASAAGAYRLNLCKFDGETSGQNVLADADGRFVAEGLAATWYRASVEASGRAMEVEIPEDGEAQVTLHVGDVSAPPSALSKGEVEERERAEQELVVELVRHKEEAQAGRVTKGDAKEVELAIRLQELHARIESLDERRRDTAPRREVVVRAVDARGRAWLVADRGGERWIAEVRGGEARFPALYAGAWSFRLEPAGAETREFVLAVPDGKGPATLAAPDP